MSLVRFAELCDGCGVRGEEYGTFGASCEDCLGDICPACVAETIHEFCCGAPDCQHQRATVVCIRCRSEREGFRCPLCGQALPRLRKAEPWERACLLCGGPRGT